MEQKDYVYHIKFNQNNVESEEALSALESLAKSQLIALLDILHLFSNGEIVPIEAFSFINKPERIIDLYTNKD